MKRILINKYATGVNISLLDDHELIEFHSDQNENSHIIGNIYKGKISNFLPGMEAAFVNIGLSRNAYLPLNEVNPNICPNEKYKSKIFKEGDSVLCQVIKEEFGNKGARISTNISLPGRLLVMLDNNNTVSISKKVENESVRDKLSQLVTSNKGEKFGYIVRTEAQYATDDEIISEIQYLENLYLDILDSYKRESPLSLLHEEHDIVSRVVRDLFRNDIDEIIVNNEQIYNKVKKQLGHIRDKEKIVRLFDSRESLIVKYNIHKQVLGLFEKKVFLPNGGYLVIESTEALTVIDVNTGRYVGDKNLEETVCHTNIMAAKEVAKQLRLRNIGGIIIVDFIDMNCEENKQKILNVLEEAFKNDRINTTLVGMTNLGLVEITRKKVRKDLSKNMLQPCPYCGSSGYVYSDDLILQILREKIINYIEFHPDATAYIVYVNGYIASKAFSLRFFEKDVKDVFLDQIIYIVPDEKLKLHEYLIKSEDKIVVELSDNAKLLY